MLNNLPLTMLSKLTKIIKKRINSRLLTIGIVVNSLALCNTVLAEYIPPSDQKPPTTKTTGTTTRTGGCRGDRQTALTALAPQAHVGQTVSSHPTFAWFVPDAESYPLEFRLYKYEASGDRTIVQKTQLQSQRGITFLTLPPDAPGLSTGKKYVWQVVLLCNPNRPSSALEIGASLDVVAMPNNLATTLASTNNSQQRVNLYASAGLWYDALGAALTARENKADQRLELELLEDLANLEAASETVPAIESSKVKHSTMIRHIIDVERQQNTSYLQRLDGNN